MSIAEKLTTIAENQQKVYEAGKEAEYNAFWDVYQKNNGVVNGTYMFGGYGWNDKVYNPKYPIILSGGGTGLFRFTEITDIKVLVDVTATPDVTHLFNWGQNIKTIPLVKVNENNIYTDWFSYCIYLKDIRFEGVIGKNLDIHWSTQLSADSIENIINCLSTTSTGQVLTLPTTAEATYNAKFGANAYATKVSSKSNWQIKTA